MYARTFQPLFPPFRQSKSREPLKITKDVLRASNDVKDIKSQVDSSIQIYDESHDNGQEKEKIVSEMDERETFEELVHRDRVQEEMDEEEEEKKVLEGYDADYQEGEKSFHEEMDYRRRVEQKDENSKKEKKLWSLKECDSLASITDKDDIDEDYTETSEPLLAHPLILPYARMPRPRFFTNEDNIEYVLESLQKAAPSPIRHVLPRRFDLRAERERIYEELRENEIRNDLRESANRISGELMQMVENGVETNRMIGSLVLRLILEEVVLTIDFVDHGIDVHTFLTMVTTIALRELKISWPGESNDRRFDENSESLFSPREEDSKGRRKSKIRSKLRKVRIPKLQTNDFLHRCLPWHLISPCHERGYIGGRFYANLRDRIGDILGNRQTELERAYTSDVTCFHLKERDMFEKGAKVSLSWKKDKGTDNRDLVELPFYFFVSV